MACRCADLGLDEIFDDRFAEKDARRYLKRGLPTRAAKLLGHISKFIDLAERTTLEPGCGSGAFTIELARQGAAHAIGIDATAPAIERARQLAQQCGVADRVEFLVADFATLAAAPPADLVVLDRVVCCYPEWQPLLDQAVRASPTVIALTYPTDRLIYRAMVNSVNLGQRLLRRVFRMRLHSAQEMSSYLEQHGYSRRTIDRYWLWEIAVFTAQ